MDIHPFEPGKAMVLGGVAIDSEVGFKAHSDGDVAIHALIDALLGAAGMGDIGELYGYEIGNVDLTILAEVPKINPYKQQIRKTLASLLQLPMQRVNIKATTAEKLGFVGRKEGVTVHAVATLHYFDWTKLISGQTS